MKSGLTRSALGLLLLPLLGAATGCSSADPAPEAAARPPSSSPAASSAKAKPAPSSSAKASASAAAAPTADAAGPAAESPAAVAPEDVVQAPQPAPVPTFAAPEQEFLEDKVPEGTDPNAVLQVGQEQCDRLISAKELDAESVLSELIVNPTQDAADAIASLCPELLPELQAAALGFPDGLFTVGAAAPHADAPSVAPGTYRAYGSPPDCTITVYSAAGALLGSYGGSAPVIIGADAASVESDQCYSWFRS